MFESLLHYAPLLSAAAALIVAVSAAWALKVVHFRAFQKSVDDRFDEILAFFWESPKVSRGRVLITYKDRYETVDHAIEKMAYRPKEAAVYSDETHTDIESINCLCACIARIGLISKMKLSRDQKRMANAVYEYWRTEIDQHANLRAYFRRYWEVPFGDEKEMAALLWADDARPLAVSGDT